MGGRRKKKREATRAKAMQRAVGILAIGIVASFLVPIIGPAVAMGGAVYTFILGVGLLEKGGLWRGGFVVLSSVLLCALAIPFSSLGTGGWLGSKASVLNDPIQRSLQRNTRHEEPDPQSVRNSNEGRSIRMLTNRQVQLESESGELSAVLIRVGEEVEVLRRDKGILTIRYRGGTGQIPAYVTDLREQEAVD